LDKPRLMECIVDLASSVPETWRALEGSLQLEPQTTADLISRTRLAISNATDFDERMVNHNFSYDYQAYEQIEQYFRQFVKAGDLSTVMQLSMELITNGSYQMEMSDEGLMYDEIEGCLNVVCNAVERSDLPPEKVLVWGVAIEECDRIGVFTRPKLAWEKTYPVEVWSAVADELIGDLGPDQDGFPVSERRRAIILRNAEIALTKARRADEIDALRKFSSQMNAMKSKRSKRRKGPSR